MPPRLLHCLGLAGGLLAFGCACESTPTAPPPPATKVQETGQDLSNPLAAVQQLAAAGEALAQKSKELSLRTPVEPVSFRALLPLLPSPEGWEASEPEGQTTSVGEWAISRASRRYSRGKGKDKATVKLEVLDGSYVPMVYAPFTMLSKFSQESTKGHTKGLSIQGYPAVEEWKVRGRKAKVTVLIDDRFLLTLSATGLDLEPARQWIAQVGPKRVAALATQ